MGLIFYACGRREDRRSLAIFSGKFQRLPEACARLPAKFGEGKALFWRTPLFFLQTSVCLLNIQCVQRPLPASDFRSRPPSPTQH